MCSIVGEFIIIRPLRRLSMMGAVVRAWVDGEEVQVECPQDCLTSARQLGLTGCPLVGRGYRYR